MTYSILIAFLLGAIVNALLITGFTLWQERNDP
jgi:hypothetical protein